MQSHNLHVCIYDYLYYSVMLHLQQRFQQLYFPQSYWQRREQCDGRIQSHTVQSYAMLSSMTVLLSGWSQSAEMKLQNG